MKKPQSKPNSKSYRGEGNESTSRVRDKEFRGDEGEENTKTKTSADTKGGTSNTLSRG